MRTIHTGVHVGGPIDGQRREYPDDRTYAEYAEYQAVSVQDFIDDPSPAGPELQRRGYELERFSTGDGTEFTLWRDEDVNLHNTMLQLLTHYKPDETDPVKIRRAKNLEEFLGDEEHLDFTIAILLNRGMTLSELMGLFSAATLILDRYGVTPEQVKECRERNGL